ncbi:hypothetical protein BC777_3042 [Yoonia maricola]|uniref:Outer membrane protein beta-barrel domain-containing protein n=1 Tax=Yoonia maricola TaxID=420999 RepID=A0A2M8W2A0_9RHOB|nr:hypothetical protein [Yoonia maricola]PJI85046.1 hypothetical protein BC777_3042 [Yoonia maricola]
MKRLIAFIIAATLGSAASAQDTYLGVGVEYHYPHAGDGQSVASGIAGIGFDTGLFGVGAEAEYGFRVMGGNDYDTARVRGWASYDWAEYSFRLSGGVTEYYFDDDTAGGFNFGIGADRDVSENLTLRGEFIRDIMDNTFTDAVTTTRIAMLYKF